MHEQGIWTPESLQNNEHRILTPEDLYRDNRSHSAYLARAEWDFAHDSSSLTLTRGCADARVILSGLAFYMRSIAASGNLEPFSGLLQHCAGVKMVTHYDGETVVLGQRPSGCGGQDGKAQLNQNGDMHGAPADGPGKFVHTWVYHEDPVMNAVIGGYEISESTRVPVVSVTQDHRTGENRLLAVYQEGKIVKSIVSEEDIIRARDTQEYDPQTLYQDGVPSLDLGYLPQHFIRPFQHQQIVLQALNNENPNLRETQKVQRPHTLLISTDPRPGKIKQPELFGPPNSVFGLRTPRIYYPDGSIRINPLALQDTILQAEYAINYALQNKDDTEKQFSTLRNIYVESRHANVSQLIIDALLQRDSVRNFMQLENAQILSGVVDQGLLVDCKQYQWTS